MASGKRRQFLVVLGFLSIGFLLLIFAAPLWAPWLLKPVLARYDISFRSFERVGYDRLNLTGVSYTATNFNFEADTVTLHQPGAWLVRHWTQQFSAEDLRVENWSATLSTETAKNTNAPPTIHQILQKVDLTMGQIEPWLATAYLKNGTITFNNQQIKIPQLSWNHGSATASLQVTNHNSEGVVSAHLQHNIKQLNINLISPLQLEADLLVQSRGSDVQLKGELAWQNNAAQLSATFDSDDLLPRTASLQSRSFRVPANLLRLEGYNDLTGSLVMDWRTNSFTLDVDALALPSNETNLPPVEASIHASGSTNFIRIEQAGISTPWLTAEISTNVVFNYKGELTSTEAAIRVLVFLDKQQFIDATGRFVGTAFLTRSEKRYPHAKFDLSSEGFAGYGVRLNSVKITGELDWPWVTIDRGDVVFADGGNLKLTSRYNAVGRFFDSGTVALDGQVGHEFLPPEIAYKNIKLDGSFSGALRAPIHSGKMEVSGLTHQTLGTFDLSSEWHGKLLEFDGLSANVETRDTRLNFAGSGAVSTNRFNLTLTNAVLQQNGKTFLTLQQPAKVEVAHENKLLVDFDQLALRHDDRELLADGKIEWPEKGTFNVSAQNIDSSWLQNFADKDLADFHVRNLQMTGGWTNGPLQFEARSNVRFAVNDTNTFIVRFDALSDSKGMVIEHLDLLSSHGPVLSGGGRLPLHIVPAETNQILRLSRNEPMNFRADTVPNKAVWEQVARLTNLRLIDPAVHLNLSGSLQNPKGSIKVKVRHAKWNGTNAQHIPPLQNIRANIRFSEDAIRVQELSFRVENQPMTAHIELPIGSDFSKPWRQMFDWRKASGRIQVNDAEVAAFGNYLPSLLMPQGIANADISFTPGPNFNGMLVLNNAATRALPNSGPLQNIDGRLRFVRQQVEIEELRGLLGGQPISFFGRIDFETNRPGNLPLMDLHLRGENVPMARRTDLVLRSDLNLHLSNVTNDVPRISGHVRLRDSFYLGDLRQLIPGRVASPKRRPPFFNVETAPFNEWRVDVAVAGENFLRARSPIFAGSVSANLHISGPLKEPIILGDVPIENGTILFPFANFKVQQGFVTLTSENPYQPQIFVRAESRAFGYDIGTTLTGPAGNPVIEFSSTPSLTSEQIILMVTAGEVPRQGFGFSSEQRAQRLALFVGKSVLSRLSDGGGAERLSITTGAEISEQGRETYALEYKINDDWSIVGEYDRFGALNVGMKWRIYSR